jgi:multidrug resistance efflux pump
VKVVQRVPVRLQLTDLGDAFRLQAGLSADVTVDTRARDQESMAATSAPATGATTR